MAVEGMDLAEVRALAAAFAKAAAALDETATSLSADLSRAPWTGPDASRFRAEWGGGHRLAVARVGEELRHQGRVLQDQVVQQETASAADGSGVMPGSGHVGASRGAGRTVPAAGRPLVDPGPLARTLTGAVPGLQEGIGIVVDGAMRVPAVRDVITPSLGFEYQGPEKDFYTTNQTSLQSHAGFMDAFDRAGFALGMDLADNVTEFSYGGRDYRLELWKGSYAAGGAFGGEIVCVIGMRSAGSAAG